MRGGIRFPFRKHLQRRGGGMGGQERQRARWEAGKALRRPLAATTPPITSPCWQKGLPCGSADKESARSAGDLGLVPGLGRSSWEDLLEKSKATHSDIPAWRISWTLQSMGWQKGTEKSRFVGGSVPERCLCVKFNHHRLGSLHFSDSFIYN